jgi:hypothetical protein
MGESKRQRQRRERTIGEDIGLRSGEPMVLKFFSGHDVLDLGLPSKVSTRKRWRS